MMKIRVSKWLFALAVPVTLGICGWQGWAWWSWATAPVQPESSDTGDKLQADSQSDESTVRIQIPPGTSGQQIGLDLETAGLIRSATAWNLWIRSRSLRGIEGGFQAGTYEISPTRTLPEIATQVWEGDTFEVGFTIPEGWTIQQMADYFESIEFFTAAEFINATRQIPLARYPWLPSQLPHLEGFLYPDTYQLPSEQVTPDLIINQMLGQFEQVALPVYQANQTQLSLLEWVTLASIVEREAVIPEERGTIAGVFARRLEEQIPLGADPTVEYALGIQQTPENPLTLKDVRTPSPYNTYINAGLPPTPISSPGVASLEAAIAPEDTEYLYFVARYDGTHVFSRTLREHEAAQAKIRDRVDGQE